MTCCLRMFHTMPKFSVILYLNLFSEHQLYVARQQLTAQKMSDYFSIYSDLRLWHALQMSGVFKQRKKLLTKFSGPSESHRLPPCYIPKVERIKKHIVNNLVSGASKYLNLQFTFGQKFCCVIKEALLSKFFNRNICLFNP